MSMLIIIGLAMLASFTFSLFLYAAFAFNSQHDPEQELELHTNGKYDIKVLPKQLHKKATAL